MEAARDALRKGEADLLFGDGIALAFWLNGTDSGGCCIFVGGPFTVEPERERDAVAEQEETSPLRSASRAASMVG